jgi:hypothetical protein
LWKKQWHSGNPADRAVVRQSLQRWRRDSDLADLRDPEAVAQLPAEVRQACRKLWADVALLTKTSDGK